MSAKTGSAAIASGGHTEPSALQQVLTLSPLTQAKVVPSPESVTFDVNRH
jgi:hypothetical protein